MKRIFTIISILLLGYSAPAQVNKDSYNELSDHLGQFKLTDQKITLLTNLWDSKEYSTFNNSLDKDQFYLWKTNNKSKEFHNCLSSDRLIIKLDKKNKINSITISSESYKYWKNFKVKLKTYSKVGQITREGIKFEKYSHKINGKTISTYLFGEQKDRFIIIKE